MQLKERDNIIMNFRAWKHKIRLHKRRKFFKHDAEEVELIFGLYFEFTGTFHATTSKFV